MEVLSPSRKLCLLKARLVLTITPDDTHFAYKVTGDNIRARTFGYSSQIHLGGLRDEGRKVLVCAEPVWTGKEGCNEVDNLSVMVRMKVPPRVAEIGIRS